MSAAFRSHGKGTLVLKGTFGGIHIERASGTNDPKRLADLKAMCRTLADKGRRDILEAIAQPRGLAPLEVWRHSGDWSRIPTPEHARELAAALEAWRGTVRGDRRRADLVSTIRIFTAAAARATVGDLPAQLLAYRNRCQAAGTARMFNKVRAELSSFVKDTLTQAHPLWLALRAVAPLPVVRKVKGQPQAVTAAIAVAEALGAPAGHDWLTLCATGMMPDEYFGGKWRLEDGRLHVLGTKTLDRTAARDRFVPLLVQLRAPLLSQDQFARILKRSGLGVRPYDGRRTFKHWCDVAGIPAVRSEIYMGHATGHRMETLYGAHESERYLEADGEALSELVAAVVSPPDGGITGGIDRSSVRTGGAATAGGTTSAPTRNRTWNLLIKRQPRDHAHDGQQRKENDLATDPIVHNPPMSPDEHP